MEINGKLQQCYNDIKIRSKINNNVKQTITVVNKNKVKTVYVVRENYPSTDS